MGAPQLAPKANESLELSDADLRFFCDAIRARAGISLSAAKSDLIRGRLRSRLQATGAGSFSDYRKLLQRSADGDPEWEAFTNLLTTNKTDFFREPRHFEFLVSDVLPEWIAKGGKHFKVWSAAASTGEEIYTLAMVLENNLPEKISFEILGTDIDTNVLRKAENAVYPASRLIEIPTEYQASCLDIGSGPAEGWFRIKPHLKKAATFDTHNLIQGGLPESTFDLVLCRNVLIYFESSNVDFVQKKLFKAVKPGGHLFIGHSESLQGLQHQWETRGPSIFRKAGR